jgi:2-alkyl-3-oxoalkanoate reductase
MRILVVGATGVLGRQVVPRLVERGHAVRAVVRGDTQARVFAALGVESRRGDILDAAGLAEAARGCDVALHLATAIPTGPHADWSRNDRIRRDGTRNLLAAAAGAGARRYVQQSITMLYGDCGQTLMDEDAPLRPTPRIQSAADMEDLVRGSGLDWQILRGGPFYGAGAGRDQEWRAAAREGRLALPGDGAALTSLIHVVDMARAVVAAAERDVTGRVYNIVDDAPVSYAELFGYIAAQAGAPAPAAGGPPIMASLACANARARGELGWQPAYPTYRSGLA